MFSQLTFFVQFLLLILGSSVLGIKSIGKGGMKQELLLKNITRILDLLLEDYDSSQHPNYKNGKPTLVHTNMLIRSMGPISELDMVRFVEVKQLMPNIWKQTIKYWRDPRLSFRGPVDSLSLSIKMLERLWRPDTFFRNGKHSYVHTITVPNKLLRLTQEGDILYSMRLTIKAKCEMCLRNFPLDSQRCGLTFGSFAYPVGHVMYSWDTSGVSFVEGARKLSQFDLVNSPFTSLNLTTREGEFSVLQVNFELVRHAGFFLIQVYVPCILIVILSWVSFWINRESTSDRVNLGITAFLTLSTISLETRRDLPKVYYATALDWFILMSFGYCMASLLEFAGVHYFTKINSSGEKMAEDEDEGEENEEELTEWGPGQELIGNQELVGLHASSLLYNNASHYAWKNSVLEIPETPSRPMETKETQTERKATCFRQFLHCIVADGKYQRERQRASSSGSFTNSVSKIDQVSRILFPVSFLILNIFYWVMYAYFHDTCERRGESRLN